MKTTKREITQWVSYYRNAKTITTDPRGNEIIDIAHEENDEPDITKKELIDRVYNRMND